jgi:hypothetical protein
VVARIGNRGAGSIVVEWDAGELRNLEVDLREAPGRAQRGARVVLANGGRRIDRGMKADARGHRYLPHLPDAVSHEFIAPLEVEIGLGPDGSQGSLAHIIAYGSVNNAPVYDHTAALRRATPRIEKDFADMLEKATLGAGGGDHT